MEKLVKKIKINTTIELLTGLHVGGSKESVQIGGIDNPVIRTIRKYKQDGSDTFDSQPYIPGSSLKGKMRCLLEQIAGSAKVGGNDKINNLFGYSQTNQPSKLIVRDAMLTEASAKELRDCENLDMPYTEGKWENVIHRVNGTAEHPRQTERIPAGVSFDVEFVVNVWDDDNAEDLVNLLKKGINALENDYLGGSGSRGYGQIKFGELKQTELSDKNNWKA